jgi:dTDP-4-amino-4,6-dideoxygalactose transaminase
LVENSETLESIREKFEKQLAEYMGTKYAVVCSSGRSAIRFSLLALGIKHRDEVVVPDYACEIIPITTFCTGAVPKFCDIQQDTLSMSPDHFKKLAGPKTKAVILVHLYGLPVDPSPILEISQAKGIPLIDDAVQALGASINGKKLGTFGNVGIISFKKFLNVRLGGAALTDDEEVAEKIRAARDKHEIRALTTRLGYRLIEIFNIKSRKAMTAVYLVDEYVSKFLSSLYAERHFKVVDEWITIDSHIHDLWESDALTDEVINQMMAMNRTYWHRRRIEKLEILSLQKEFRNVEHYLEERRRIAKTYEENLNENGFAKIIPLKGSTPSYMKYPIIFRDEKKCSECMAKMAQQGFKVSYLYRPLHESPIFSGLNENASFKGTMHVVGRLLPLPVDPYMDDEQIRNLVDIINSQA